MDKYIRHSRVRWNKVALILATLILLFPIQSWGQDPNTDGLMNFYMEAAEVPQASPVVTNQAPPAVNQAPQAVNQAPPAANQAPPAANQAPPVLIAPTPSLPPAERNPFAISTPPPSTKQPTSNTPQLSTPVSTSATEGYFDLPTSSPAPTSRPKGANPVSGAASGAKEDDLFVDPFSGTPPAPLYDTPLVAPGSVSPGSDTVLVPLGQNPSLPPTQWENAGKSGGDSLQYLSGAASPEFDSTQGQWLQLEVGQADLGGQAQTAPKTITTVPTQPTDIVIDQALGVPRTEPLDSSDREQLRHLFSDLLPPASQGARKQPPPAPTVPMAKAVPAPQAKEKVINRGKSSILQAGGLLTIEEHQSELAKVTPPKVPLKSPAVVPKKEAPKAVAPKTAAPKKETPKKVSPGKEAPKKAAPPKIIPKATTTAELMIINETGEKGLGEIYRSVLTRVGFKVVSLGIGTNKSGSKGQTIINYRPGHKADAQAVARNLPGRKILIEAKKDHVLASEIMVYLR